MRGRFRVSNQATPLNPYRDSGRPIASLPAMPEGNVVHALDLQRTLEPYGEISQCFPTAKNGVSVDYITMKPCERVEPHIHDDADQVLIFIAGSATVELDGKATRVGKGHVVLVPRGVRHGISTADDVAIFFDVHARKYETHE